jgi:hypothetical protein
MNKGEGRREAIASKMEEEMKKIDEEKKSPKEERKIKKEKMQWRMQCIISYCLP